MEGVSSTQRGFGFCAARWPYHSMTEGGSAIKRYFNNNQEKSVFKSWTRSFSVYLLNMYICMYVVYYVSVLMYSIRWICIFGRHGMAWLFTFAFCRLACVVSCHVCLRSLLIAFNINGWTNREEKEGRKEGGGRKEIPYFLASINCINIIPF